MKHPAIIAFSLLLGTSLALPSLQHVNRELEERDETPFTGFHDCKFRQKRDIITAWHDVAKLATIPAEFNLDQGHRDFFPGACPGICTAGTLEQRIWGGDIGTNRPDHVELIRTVFNNIRDLNSKGAQIRISCVDQKNPLKADSDQAKCANVVSGKSIGGYAISTSTQHKDNMIVLCPPFFAPGQEHLGEIVKDLEAHPEKRKRPIPMAGKARMLLHELTHLAAIEEKFPIIVKDQKWNPAAGDVLAQGTAIYGLGMVEKFAKKYSTYTHLNADTYAWYATLKYFEAKFGTPDAVNQGRDEDSEGQPENKPTKALNIILEQADIGIAPESERVMKWLFYSVPQGTASECSNNPIPAAEALTDGAIKGLERPPFPAGTFKVKTPDGDCEYKNDGKGNPGALWCGDKAHSCKAHDNKDKGHREGESYCYNLGKGIGQIAHRAVVSCEW